MIVLVVIVACEKHALCLGKKIARKGKGKGGGKGERESL